MHTFDLLLLGFKGVAIASLPLASVWVGRSSGSAMRLRRLAWVTAFLTFDLVVFGGFTRLTDSGLGCPDWPGCYARANPFMAADDIRAAQEAMPSGPVTMNKAWIEMIHRYLAMGVGLLIVTMLVLSVVRARKDDREATARTSFPFLAAALLGMVVLQGAFGAWTVTQRLQPIFVTTHLMLGLGLLALLTWHALKLDRTSTPAGEKSFASSPGPRGLAACALLVLTMQIALGGWVSANYAVLACTDFPTCQGAIAPPMDFANGFAPWRELGRAVGGGYLSLEALTAIHWTHRAFATIAFVVLGLLAGRLWRSAPLAKAARVLTAVLVLQGATGLANVVLGWPLAAAILHNAGAAALVVTLVVINYRLSERSRPAPALDHRTSRRSARHFHRVAG